VDGQRGKLVTVIGHQFITLTVDICVQLGGQEALRLSAAAKTWFLVSSYFFVFFGAARYIKLALPSAFERT